MDLLHISMYKPPPRMFVYTSIDRGRVCGGTVIIRFELDSEVAANLARM